MARIPYPDPATQTEDTRQRLERLGSLNITRMISHSEGALQGYSRLGTFLLRKGRLDPILREIAILRIGQLCGSDYEWHQHASVARTIGMDEATLQSIADHAFDRLTEAQQVAVAVAEEIRRDGGASRATIEHAARLFTAEELVELCLAAGYYIMTAGLLLSLDIEIEATPPLGASMTVSLAPPGSS